MEDHQTAVQITVLAGKGGARVKCVGGLVAQNSEGVQHNYRLAKNTKKKELGTAHHNDASSTGYLITVTLHQ